MLHLCVLTVLAQKTTVEKSGTVKARTHRDKFRARYSPTFNAS